MSTIVVLSVLSPVVQNHREKPEDGFPLSYFPMFTRVRDGHTTVHHPVAVRPDGTTVDLGTGFAGAGGTNSVRRQINRFVRSGRSGALCRGIAHRFADSDRDAAPDAVAIALVGDTFEFDRWFAGDRTPSRRVEHARIALPAPGGAR